MLFTRALLTLFRPLTYVLFDFIGRIVLGKQKMLPPIRDKILLMSAVELADHIRKRKVTAEEVMKAYIDRVREVDRFINACVDQRFEEALSDARAVDKMLEAGNLTDRQLATELPLLGVPFSCKEIVGVKGMTQTNGLLFFKDRKADLDGEIVTLYRKAGAIPYVVTNVPTVCMGWETCNMVFGRTMNPYDNRRTVGGSSGGEAAILTTAGAVIGIGTDIGGSIRIPAAFCGIYGHKPSRGIISNQKSFPNINHRYDPFRSTGPMCRYVQDLRLLVRISSGNDARKLNLDEKVDFTKVKVYYMEEIPGFCSSATSDVKKAVRKAVNHIQDKYGTAPTKIHLEEMAHAFDIWQNKFIEAGDKPPFATMKDQMNINWYWELAKCLFGRARFELSLIAFALFEKSDKDGHYYKSLETYEALRSKLEDILAGDSVLILPTHPEPAPHLLSTIPKVKNIGYTCIFNILGYPATNIPSGMSSGVPIGLQAVAAQFNDRLTLATAEELDSVFRGWNSPCDIIL